MEKFWFKYLAQTCRKDHHFIKLSHLLEEGIDSGTFQDIKVVPVVFDLDGHDEIWGRNRLR